MPKTNAQNRPSLYLYVAAAITLTVALVMSSFAVYTYHSTKTRLTEEMRHSAEESINLLEGNMATFVESYAINEYMKLITTDMEHKDYLAVVVEDFNMGRIFGQEAYINGKIRLSDGRLADFDSQNPAHLQLIGQAFLTQEQKIYSPGGAVIGRLKIYLSDQALQQEINRIVTDTLWRTLAISVVLTGLLFLALRQVLLQPLASMAENLADPSDDGLPQQNFEEVGPREVVSLAQAMNTMLATTRASQANLMEQKEKLRQEKERFALAIDGTLDGLWDWDLKTDHVFHSDRFETMLGYEPGELPEHISCWHELLHPEDVASAQAAVQGYLESWGSLVYESTFRMRTKAGGYAWITGRGKAQFDEEGHPVRFVGFNTDVTDRQNLLEYQKQARLAAEEANQAKSAFLRMMSHELRTPMNGVLGMAQLLKMTDLDQEQDYLLEVMMDSGKSLVSILTNILDFAKMEAGKQEVHEEPTSLNNLVESVCALMSGSAQTKGLELDWYFDPAIDEILAADGELLKRILVNLVGNAVKYTKAGSVRVQVDLLKGDATTQEVRFQVVDTGIGVPEDLQEKIFEAFEQVDSTMRRQFGGTGLGLALTREVAKLMGGEVNLEWSSPEGSCFTVLLPFKRIEEQTEASEEALPLQRSFDTLGRREVLLAEDDQINRLVVQRMLQQLDLTCEVAVDGQEALEKSRQRRYDLIFMDVLMPTLNGLSATAEIRRQEDNPNRDTPIIALTALAGKDDQERCMRAGMDGFLKKPVEFNQLGHVIESLPQAH